MTYLPKPKLHHPAAAVNALGYSRRDYESAVSTLCAGCGHDAISAAIVQACFELDLAPHRVAKLSGIGCSSKTLQYFLGAAHGLNGLHGRMPSALTGANLANRDLIYLAISGDGDSASIGLGHFAHIIRRGVNMTYIVENNGVYGLTRGQFSATADKGSAGKGGAVNADEPVDLVSLAVLLGATFVARGFSGDREQLVPLIKAAFLHGGSAFIDCLSPCVAFNNQAGSTKSFEYVRGHDEAVNAFDLVLGNPETAEEFVRDEDVLLRMRKREAEYDLHDRVAAMAYLETRRAAGTIVTGLLYLDPEPRDLHAHLETVDEPLTHLGDAELCPGGAALAAFNGAYR